MPHQLADLAQHEVDALLENAGLLRLRNFASSAPQSVNALRAQAAHCGGPVVLSLLAEEVPDLVPEPLVCAQVLFFALPPAMEQLLPRLLTAGWDCYGRARRGSSCLSRQCAEPFLKVTKRLSWEEYARLLEEVARRFYTLGLKPIRHSLAHFGATPGHSCM